MSHATLRPRPPLLALDHRCGLALLLATVGLTASASCGGEAVVNPGSGTPTGTGTTTSSGTGTGGTTGTGTSTGTTSTGTGAGGSSALEMVLYDVGVGVNCMPSVAPDPVMVFFEAEYDNLTGSAPGEATIVGARAILGSGAQMLTWTFDVTPAGSGIVPAGQLVTLSHQKVPDSGSGDSPASPCEFCAAPGATLQLDVSLGSTAIMIEQSADFGCAY